MRKSEHIESLYKKYLSGACNPEEIDEFLEAFASEQNEAMLKEIIGVHFEDHPYQQDDHAIRIANNVEAKLFPIIFRKNSETKILKIRLWPRVAAAVIFITMAIGLTLYISVRKRNLETHSVYASDIAPGKFGATLTLANGKKIRMVDISNGEIAKEAGITITKTLDGQLIYQIKEKVNRPDQINTLSTAEGETYTVTLPDKSKVWLNAASSLIYFTSLNENGPRRVKLEGEAYFEISKDKSHPFIVQTDKQEVEVLGTHFNINSYPDEKEIKTTLLEGAVRVSIPSNKIQLAPELAVVLTPGQQCVFNDKGDLVTMSIDAEDIIAWKNGKFSFNNETLQSIMRKVTRWYNVEVIFQNDELMNRTFSGKLSRFESVSKVLRILELTGGAKFKIEGRKITVL